MKQLLDKLKTAYNTLKGLNKKQAYRLRLLLSFAFLCAAVIFFAIALLVGIPRLSQKSDPSAVNANAAGQTQAPTQGTADWTADPLTGETPNPNGTPDPLATTEPTAEPSATPATLKKHDKGEDVQALQVRLMELGYLAIEEPTDYFGSSTEYALELFQRQHELDQDGVAGSSTLTLLYSDDAKPYVMKEGAEGRDVKMLQEQLVDLGYLSNNDVDRIYGPTTIAAVTAFQKRNSLTADGKAGEKTLDRLYSDDARVSSALEKKLKEQATTQKDDTTTEKKETKIDKFIKAAKAKIGCEYVLGDRGPNTFDCSGFVYWCLRQAGVSCNRLNAAGFSKKSSWKNISSYGDVQKGDILFFRSDESSTVSHCGIYIGSGMMIDASSANGQVIKRSVSAYWKRNFVNARRPWA